MNTTELAERLATRLGVSKAEARRLIRAHLEAVAVHLTAGDSVVLRGFGTFEVRHTRAHPGRLPGSDTATLIPGHRRPHFRPSAALKTRVNEPESS